MRSPTTSSEAATLANEIQLRRMRAEAKKKHLEAQLVEASAECLQADLEHHAMIEEFNRLATSERAAMPAAPRTSAQRCDCARCSADRQAAN